MVIIYILISFATFYIAGTYQNKAILTLFILEVFIFILMLILALYLKFNIKYYFKERNSFSYKGKFIKNDLVFENKGILPILRLKFKCRNYYLKRKENKPIKFKGGINSKSNYSPKLNIIGDYCGIMRLKVYALSLFDYLSIFKLKSNKVIEKEIVVLPIKKELKFVPLKSNVDIGDIDMYSGSGNSMEISQLKEYEDGMPMKNIHWNIFAKTDELYYKEYSDTTSNRIIFYISIKDIDKIRKNITEADAFYELCSGIMYGLLKINNSLIVCWLSDEGFYSKNIDTEDDIKNTLINLYYAKEGDKEYNFNEENSISVNTKLELLFNNTVVYQFSTKGYKNEILTKEIIL